MSCFDHSPLMISQLILPIYEDHDSVDAENRSLSRRAAHLPGFTNSCQNCAVWTGRAILSSLSSIYRADGTVVHILLILALISLVLHFVRGAGQAQRNRPSES